ncbi:hypothetical protein ACHAXT_001165 [Thalassiosira profunda]
MTDHPPHASEWIYSSPISRCLAPLNEGAHALPSLPHPAEIFVAACGYAFNPVMFPLWPSMVYALTHRGLSNASAAGKYDETDWWRDLAALKPMQGALINATVYIASVLVTLAFTELGKTSFATTRPRVPPGGYDNTQQWTRRYGTLVASLKSRHSFPSGDSAQAMNLCLFLRRYVPLGMLLSSDGVSLLNLLMFGIFVPGVAFARVFYRCHWIEDCAGGIALSWALHSTVMPAIARILQTALCQLLVQLKNE